MLKNILAMFVIVVVVLISSNLASLEILCPARQHFLFATPKGKSKSPLKLLHMKKLK
jgi:hypothetical protein